MSEILLDLGPSRLRRMAEDTQSLSRPDKFSQRPRPHFLHDVTAMNFDGFFRYAQRVGDLLVKHPVTTRAITSRSRAVSA